MVLFLVRVKLPSTISNGKRIETRFVNSTIFDLSNDLFNKTIAQLLSPRIKTVRFRLSLYRVCVSGGGVGGRLGFTTFTFNKFW